MLELEIERGVYDGGETMSDGIIANLGSKHKAEAELLSQVHSS